MHESSSPVTERTIKQIERISDLLFERAVMIPGVAPNTEDGIGTGDGAEMFDDGLVYFIRERDSTDFFPGTQLWAGYKHDKVEIQDFRQNTDGSTKSGIILRRELNMSRFKSQEVSAIQGTVKRYPKINENLTIENVSTTQNLSDEEVRYYAAHFFRLVKKYLSDAELNSDFSN